MVNRGRVKSVSYFCSTLLSQQLELLSCMYYIFQVCILWTLLRLSGRLGVSKAGYDLCVKDVVWTCAVMPTGAASLD
jgi:hypothetical protein